MDRLWRFKFKTGAMMGVALLLAGCAGGQRRQVSVTDLDGVKSRIDGVQRELSGDADAARMSAPVKTFAGAEGSLEFEAEGEGVATKYERLVDAEKRAERDALAAAVREAGVNVYSASQNVMSESDTAGYQFIGKYTNVWADSLVSYERAAPPECSFSGGRHLCKVRLRGRVHLKGKRDPGFELKAGLDKPAYFEGDDLSLRLRLSKDAYVTVLSCDEDGNVTTVFPNRHSPDNFFSAGEETVLPGDRYFRLRAWLPPGRGEASELLHVIATKDQTLAPPEKGGVKDLAGRLALFDRADWTGQVLFYSVKSRD